jgi:cytoskeletal protein RodZ
MKRVFSLVLVGLLVAVVMLVYFKHLRNSSSPASETVSSPESSATERPSQPTNGSPTNSPNSTSPSEALSTAPANPESLAARAGERPADTNAALSLPPDSVLQNVRRVVRQYGEMFGGNPVGTNPEITAALSGNNPKHINFLTGQPGLRVNDNGELVDAWGTPYFFHQISGSVMEIHSAGPDRVMWTSDDLVTK